MRARIYVTLKRAVLDPQGKVVEHSLHELGFSDVEEVRIGKFIEMQLRSTDREQAGTQVEQMCHQLLANGVIEDYRYELEA